MKLILGYVCFVCPLGMILSSCVIRCVDLSVIGHLRQWKKIKCLINYWRRFFREGYDVLEDCTIHPQTFVLFCVHLLFFGFWFASMVLITSHSEEVDEWVYLLIGVIGYSIVPLFYGESV